MSNNSSKVFYQARILSERYIEVFFSDFTSLFFLIFQPIAVALCIGLVWKNTTGSATLYFVLLFSSIFFGCINSCREIVKERSILARERIIGLNVTSYILSKILVLAILGFAQVLIFYISVRFNLILDGNPFLTVLALYISLLCGTSLGLCISSFVASDVMALSLVPVFLIPQLLFSKLIMPTKSLIGAVFFIEKITIVKWGYDFLEQVTISTKIDWSILSESFFVLVFMIVFLNVISGLIIKVRKTQL